MLIAKEFHLLSLTSYSLCTKNSFALGRGLQPKLPMALRILPLPHTFLWISCLELTTAQRC